VKRIEITTLPALLAEIHVRAPPVALSGLFNIVSNPDYVSDGLLESLRCAVNIVEASKDRSALGLRAPPRNHVNHKARHSLRWVQLFKCPQINFRLGLSGPILSSVVARPGLRLGVHGPDGPISVPNHCVKLNDELVLGVLLAAIEASMASSFEPVGAMYGFGLA